MNIGHTGKRTILYSSKAKSSGQILDKGQAVFAAQPKTSDYLKKDPQPKQETLLLQNRRKKSYRASDGKLTDDSLVYDSDGRQLLGQKFDYKA